MCELCNGHKRVGEESYIRHSDVTKKFYLELFDEYEETYNNIEINYCPVCGRKLEEK